MGRNPVEDNFVVSFLLGLGVLLAMALVGQGIGLLLLALGVPYARWVGVAIGIAVVFTAFIVVYGRYDSMYDRS